MEQRAEYLIRRGTLNLRTILINCFLVKKLVITVICLHRVKLEFCVKIVCADVI